MSGSGRQECLALEWYEVKFDDSVAHRAQVALVELLEQALVLAIQYLPVAEVTLQDFLIQGVQLLHRVLRDRETILVQDWLFWIVDHFSLCVESERVIGLGLGEDVHLSRDDLDIRDVLQRQHKHHHKVSHYEQDPDSKLNKHLLV
jgi:hypothetical protein